jgi:NTP pyrophosphatase (non-canonical NTP hydrolase)
MSLNDDIVRISQMIDDTYPADLDDEAHRWRRCMKVVEEAGEVTEALLGMVGENPRKGQTHDLNDVRLELLDVALAALGAVAHLDGNVTDVVFDFTERTGFLADRLERAIEGATS